MRGDTRPVEMVEDFLKSAAVETGGEKDTYRAFGSGDTSRRTAGRSSIGQDKPKYTAPSPPAAETRPELVESQKSLPPPPVQ